MDINVDLNGARLAVIPVDTNPTNCHVQYGNDVAVSGCVDYGTATYPYDYATYPSLSYWPYTIEKEVEPKSCMGKSHVFECEHVETCKCGAIRRVMPRVTLATKSKRRHG